MNLCKILSVIIILTFVSAISIFEPAKSFAQSNDNSSTLNHTTDNLRTPINTTALIQNTTDSAKTDLKGINESLKNGDTKGAIDQYVRMHDNISTANVCATSPP